MIAGFRRQRLIPLTQDRLYVVGGKRRIGPPFSVGFDAASTIRNLKGPPTAQPPQV
jgi:hypothetical protein